MATTMLPVMIVTLVAVLQNRDIQGYLLIGFPGAFAAALAWTAFRMRMAPAEVVISGGLADVRTVLDAVRGTRATPSHPVLDVRRSPEGFQVTIGTSVYDLADADWHEPSQLVSNLVAARATAYGPLDENLMESPPA